MKQEGFTQHHFSTKSGAGFTIVELLLVVAVMALLTAALSPLFRTSYQAWRLGDRRAEVIQNARIGMDKMSWELKQIKMVSGVSSPTDPQGYITFLDYEENFKEFRYEVGYLAYVSGTVATLAGPIESLYFSCYESNGSTLTTSLTNISIIVAQMVTSDEEGEVDSLTTTDRIYLRKCKGWVQVNWSGGTTTPTLEVVTATTTKYYQGTNVDHTTSGQVTLAMTTADHVVISKVLMNGVANDEVEKVELYNPTGSPVDLSGWTLDTQSYANDATIASGKSIPAYGFFTIGDSGGDYNETITLTDTNACVQIQNASSVTIDAVGWGTPTGGNASWEGTAAPNPASTEMLERKAQSTSTAASMADGGADADKGNGYDTNNNVDDIIVRTAVAPKLSTDGTEYPPGGSGTLESSVYDTGAIGTYYGIISWDASAPINTDVKFQIRTGISISDLSSKSFVGPDGMTDTYYTTSGTDIWSGHNEDQYIQYKAVLTTTDPLISPTLYEVAIELE